MQTSAESYPDPLVPDPRPSPITLLSSSGLQDLFRWKKNQLIKTLY